MDEKKLVEPEKCAENKRPPMSEERKFAILFAATLLAARKLIDLDPYKPNMAKGFLLTGLLMMQFSSLRRSMNDGPLVDSFWPIFRRGNQILVDASVQFRFTFAPRAPRQLDSPDFAGAGARPPEFVRVK